MKAQTRIKLAVKLARQAYCDYARIVLNEPVRVRNPVVEWRAGLGWAVDGKRFPDKTAGQVIGYYDDLQRQYHQSIKDYFNKPAPTLDDELDAASDPDVVKNTQDLPH